MFFRLTLAVPNVCNRCPSVNMVTKNSTTRDSIGTCFCAKGYFRAAVLYDYEPEYTPEIQAPAVCGGYGSYLITAELGDLPDVERRRRRASRRARKRRQGDNATDEEGDEAEQTFEGDDICVYGGDPDFGEEDITCATWFGEDDDDEGGMLDEGSSLKCLGRIEFESVNCGRVSAYLSGPYVDAARKLDDGTECPAIGQTTPKICVKCKSPEGCRGDSYGVGTQGCAPTYKGVLCALCEDSYYLTGQGICEKCPSEEATYQTIAIAAAVAVVGGAIALRYLSTLKLLADPPSLKIVAAYLIITSAISSSYNVELPNEYSSYSSQTSFVQLDVTGTLNCVINGFEFTYYHNIVLYASLPFVIGFMATAALTLRLSMIQTHFDAKRRADRKGLLTEKINTQEQVTS